MSATLKPQVRKREPGLEPVVIDWDVAMTELLNTVMGRHHGETALTRELRAGNSLKAFGVSYSLLPEDLARIKELRKADWERKKVGHGHFAGSLSDRTFTLIGREVAKERRRA